MKRLFLLVVIVAMILPSCKKINEAIDDLDNRLNKLEQEAIPSIDAQISAINTTIGNLDAMDKELKGYIDNLTNTASLLQEQISTTNTKIDEVEEALQKEIENNNTENLVQVQTAKAEVLAQLAAAKAELVAELAQINNTIATLQEKDKELDKKIADLNNYVETELSSTEDWANATFATLEQYNALVLDVTDIKEQMKAINQSIADLETRLTTKINENIANAVSTLNADIQQKVKDITDAYTNAVETAKDEITSAYTTAIQTAITTLDNSLKTWVGEQLANYYTIAEVDAMFATMEQEMNGKFEAQKAYLEGLINELSAALTKSIADNKELIEGLQKDIATLQEAAAEHASKIAENATAISTNTQNIIDLSKSINENKEKIAANEKAIADCKALIEANTKLIAENKSAVDTLKNSTNTAIANNAIAIAENAENIATNAALISANAVAINNNASAIANNTADILQLQQDLATAKAEITEAYKTAINDAITTNNGVIEDKIAAKVSSINTRINDEVATINNTIETLASRVSAVESEIANIQLQVSNMLAEIEDIKEDIAELLTRIQSVSYVPKFSDGNATMDYGTKTAEFDFLVSPKSAVAELAKVWNSALSVKAVYTQTRAVEFINLPITEFVADNSNGVISIQVSGTNLSDAFYTDQQDAKAMLQITDGNSSLTSEYISMTPNFNIQFEDFNVKRRCVHLWDTNGDFELSYSEAAEVTTIGTNFKEGAYYYFDELQYFTRLSEIEESAFQGSALRKITLPNGIRTIGANAFDNCIALKRVDVSLCDNLNIIGVSAFQDTSIREIFIPNDVHKIDDKAFYNCSNLKNLIFEENSNLVCIGVSAFEGAIIQMLTIPASVNIIKKKAFTGCPLESLIFEKDSKLELICGYDGTRLEMRNYVPYGAFSNCTKLRKITIPQSVTTLECSAFEGCTSLEQVIFENNSNLAKMGGAINMDPGGDICAGHGVFTDCSSLKNIILPSGLLMLEIGTFAGCTNLVSVEFESGSQLSSITGDKCGHSGGCVTFGVFNGCKSLTTIKLGVATPPSCSSFSFYGITKSNIKLKVPAGSLGSYQSSSSWKSFKIEEYYK